MPQYATIDITDARRQFTTLNQRLATEHVIWVTRHHKPAFAVVNADYLQAIWDTLEILQFPDAAAKLKKAVEDIAAGRVHDHEDVKREILSEESR